MPTREVLSQFAQSESEATGLGPVQDTTDPTPQSLLERHQNLAARANNPTYHPAAPSNNGATQASQDRVRSTGARTPSSLAAEIEAQIKRVADGKMEKKDQGDKEIKKG
ncbi:hypothetical protein EDB80DRAFT_156388 [Ilyonectria destructans]|nr:hypothetical protein EDB80DRAFT_156388 [Ilyonectria destructans]